MREAKKSKRSIRTKILIITLLPLMVMIGCVLVINTLNMVSTMQSSMYEELKGISYSMNKSMNQVNQDSIVDNNGEISKGDYMISNNNGLVDEIKEKMNLEVSIFYGNKRVATTICDTQGERTIGQEAADVVVQTVIENGEDYKGIVTIGGAEYLGYYTPLHNVDGTIVGMVFAGKHRGELDNALANTVAGVLGSSAVVLVLAVVVIIVFTNALIRKFKGVEHYLLQLKDGDLACSVPDALLKERTEIGQMATSARMLSESLKQMIGQIKLSSRKLRVTSSKLKETSQVTNETTGNVSKAIDGIAKGALTQAEETETATEYVMTIGDQIKEISKLIELLVNQSNLISDKGDQSMDIVGKLEDSNQDTLDVVEKIAVQLGHTYDSIQEIKEVVSFITAIAEETNLLSLNASIEAARAGENGRGFAVVAGQIQNLAEQSNISAKKIEDIVGTLIVDANETLSIMNDVKDTVSQQSSRLDDTKLKFQEVSEGIHISQIHIHEIGMKVDILNENRVGIVENIQSLSAIAQENAAASEETTASTEELVTIVEDIKEEASELSVLSEELDRNVSMFKID